MKATGRALCIGVRADEDALTFASIARGSGFVEPLLLLEERATRAAVEDALSALASESEPGDIVFITFSGHGGRKARCLANGEWESVPIWQLHDGAFHDGELQSQLARFREGVRVLVISDNCSGGLPSPRKCSEAPALNASVMVLSASQRDQYADGPGLPGHFARAFGKVWEGGAFGGTYAQFHRALVLAMPEYQTPDFYGVGSRCAQFEAQRPLCIESGQLTSG